jgi:ribonuclease R
MYVEGLVHITELGGEYFRFDEARQELRGERTGIRYAIGSRVRVQVSRVDLDGRRIDFRLVHEGQELPLRGGKDRPPEDGQERKAARKARRDGIDAPAAGRSRAALLSPPGTPLQSLKAAVKKAAAKVGRKQGKKPRR